MKLTRLASQRRWVFSLLIALSFVASACQPTPPPAMPVATTIAPSETPVPTDTATPVPTDTPTATATVTRTATPDRKATQAVKQTATQAAINEVINAELVKYEIDPSLGHVSWVMQEPIELDGAGYATDWFLPIQGLGSLKDFVFQTEILWTTSGGLSGCGYFFRAREDMDLQIGDFYALRMLRLQYAPVWWVDYIEDGYWKYSLPDSQGVVSKNIEDEKMSRNILTLAARGSIITVYINGIKERTIENNKITEGRLALAVLQESGTSYCKFEKGWVWEYDE